MRLTHETGCPCGTDGAGIAYGADECFLRGMMRHNCAGIDDSGDNLNKTAGIGG